MATRERIAVRDAEQQTALLTDMCFCKRCRYADQPAGRYEQLFAALSEGVTFRGRI
jgi:hypothetical protein